MGFSCRLACKSEHWRQTVTVLAPASNLAPIEADIETPFGTQRVALERSMSLPDAIQRALQEIHHLVKTVKLVESQVELASRDELVERARAIENELLEGMGRLQRSGAFQWPMDRFQLLISNGVREELVTVGGPLMTSLARGWLADETQPGVGVREIAAAAVKLLMDRSIEPGRSVGAGFRAREEGVQLAELLREHLVSLS